MSSSMLSLIMTKPLILLFMLGLGSLSVYIHCAYTVYIENILTHTKIFFFSLATTIVISLVVLARGFSLITDLWKEIHVLQVTVLLVSKHGACSEYGNIQTCNRSCKQNIAFGYF